MEILRKFRRSTVCFKIIRSCIVADSKNPERINFQGLLFAFRNRVLDDREILRVPLLRRYVIELP